MLAAASELRLTLDDFQTALDERARAITRQASAKGTLLTGGTIRELASAMLEILHAAGGRVIRALLGVGMDDRRVLVEETRAALHPAAAAFAGRHEKRLRSPGKATRHLAEEADRWFAALPDRVARAMRDKQG